MSAIEQTEHRSPETRGDARVRRTRRALYGALGSLLHERPFESIAIKQILARADVARSSFYAHFESKEELLASAIDETIDQADSATHGNGGLLRFALPLFEHIERLRSTAGPEAKMLRFHSRAHESLRRSISQFAKRELARNGNTGALATLISEHVASTFIVVLEWWLTNAPELPAGQVHRQYEVLLSGVASTPPVLKSGLGQDSRLAPKLERSG